MKHFNDFLCGVQDCEISCIEVCTAAVQTCGVFCGIFRMGTLLHRKRYFPAEQNRLPESYCEI